MIAELRELVTDDAQVVYRPVENVIVPAPWHRGPGRPHRRRRTRDFAARRQGAAQAIEDGLVLGEELGRARAAAEALERVHGPPLRPLQAGRRASAAIGAWEQKPDPDVDPNDIRHGIIAVCAVPV